MRRGLTYWGCSFCNGYHERRWSFSGLWGNYLVLDWLGGGRGGKFAQDDDDHGVGTSFL